MGIKFGELKHFAVG